MVLAESDVASLRQLCGGLAHADEGGRMYLRLNGLKLPAGCKPSTVDALLCLAERDGYPTRLFFGELLDGPHGLNWNALGVVILGQQWWAFSWRVPAGLSIADTLANHLRPLRQSS